MNLRHRPGLGVRSAVSLAGIGIVLINAVLLLSDRAPRILRSVFGDGVRRITDRLDAGGRGNAAITARDIGDDSIVHFGLWAVAMFVIGLAVWSWIGLATASLAVAATSLMLEVAQGRYSSSRAVEVSDAAFNFLGVAAGATVAACLYMLVEGVGRLFSPPG